MLSGSEDREMQDLNRYFGALVVAAIAASPAAADVIGFDIFANDDGADTSFLDLTLDVVDGGSFIEFVFINNSTDASFISDVYFEHTAASSSLINPLQDVKSGVIDFSSTAEPGSPPGAISGLGGDWNGNHYARAAVNPQPTWGINPNESLGIQFDLNGASYQDIVDALYDQNSFRIVIKIQGIAGDGDGSTWGVTPTPGTATVLALAGLTMTRRRR